ncbi:MAG: A/G-specific adenine glycosylase [Sulfurimonas sp.]|nr:A/G-specific adenine glycosylase [Sulfurimonas sp.]MBU3940157.1 A/G-specific adenine glycosylase [bacterium]MBU4023544.1 A/G-specific adenine glycosylase [bacterium]MBU4058746.1 A/G-specific adenine glycosylase [bacterium]MBU4111236.1 A/G-specific adenine glycosylase [bacterium]
MYALEEKNLLLEPRQFETAQKKLLEWYEVCGRHELPWRLSEDVYHVYVSEIMLQQTQVNRVMQEYYPQFLEKFPTLKALSEADEAEVLAAWSGLGYYSRARNLHATAKLCPQTLPQTLDELLKLPGIGPYTASAICSFAYNQQVGVVDTNIERVIKRFFALSQPSVNKVNAEAGGFVNAEQPRAHNLALMDLGSLVCLPNNPKCEECPLAFSCDGKNEPEFYTKKEKKVYENLELFYGVCEKNEKIALVKSSARMYKGMLELPNVEPLEEDFIAAFKHSYTKYRLTVKLYKTDDVEGEVFWYNHEEIQNAPISSLTRKAFGALQKAQR